MSDDGSIVIGWQQIYDKVVSLEATLHQHVGQQTTQLATLSLRVSEVEKDVAKLETKRDADAADRSTLRRMVWVSLVGMIGALLANLVPLLIHH